MKEEYVTLSHPVPSCQINKIIFEDGRWLFQYKLENKGKTLLEDATSETPVFIYSHISNLQITDSLPSGSVNIRVEGKDEYIGLLEKQYQSDKDFRAQWIENNPDIDYFELVNVKELSNETQEVDYLFLIDVIEQKDETTKFIFSSR